MANLNIRVDDDLKTQAEQVLSELGLSMTTAVNVFLRLRQVVRCNSIPFALQADPFHSPENQRRLLISKRRMEQKGETLHDLLEVSDD